MSAYICTHMPACTHIHTHTHRYLDTNMYVYSITWIPLVLTMCAFVYVWMCTCVRERERVCACVCACVYAYAKYTHTYRHTHIYMWWTHARAYACAYLDARVNLQYICTLAYIHTHYIISVHTRAQAYMHATQDTALWSNTIQYKSMIPCMHSHARRLCNVMERREKGMFIVDPVCSCYWNVDDVYWTKVTIPAWQRRLNKKPYNPVARLYSCQTASNTWPIAR